MSKVQVSRICRVLDDQVEGFRTRPFEVSTPNLRLDAKHLKSKSVATSTRRR